MDMRELLNRLMDLRGDNAHSLEDKSGVPQPTTNRFLSGKHGDPRSTTIKKWAAAYGISESQLRGDVPLPDGLLYELGGSQPQGQTQGPAPTTPTGTGAMNLATAHSATVGNNVVVIRHYDTGGKMGDGGVILRDQPGLIESWTVTPEWIQKNIKNCSAAANLCVVTGFGDSMRPLYEPGDPLIVDTGVKQVDFVNSTAERSASRSSGETSNVRTDTEAQVELQAGGTHHHRSAHALPELAPNRPRKGSAPPHLDHIDCLLTFRAGEVSHKKMRLRIDNDTLAYQYSPHQPTQRSRR